MSLIGYIKVLLGCAKKDRSTFRSVSVEEFGRIISDSSVVTLDVRTKVEYAEGHIDGAVHIDVLKDSFMDIAKEQLPKDRTIALYCRTGRRSKSAARMLAREGFQVVEMDKGYVEWEKSGKPVTKSR